MTVEDFDWRTQTTLQGTVFRVAQIVRGTCGCGRENVLLYDTYEDPVLMCSDCSHFRAAAANKRQEICDECGTVPAWRDPITRRNEFFCATCHGRHGTVFANRWANKPRVSTPLRNSGIVCAAKGYGTDCKGELKWRSAFNKTLCNKHAGKQGVGPNG